MYFSSGRVASFHRGDGTRARWPGGQVGCPVAPTASALGGCMPPIHGFPAACIRLAALPPYCLPGLCRRLPIGPPYQQLLDCRLLPLGLLGEFRPHLRRRRPQGGDRGLTPGRSHLRRRTRRRPQLLRHCLMPSCSSSVRYQLSAALPPNSNVTVVKKSGRRFRARPVCRRV
jgi:hypothetical protein